MCRSRLGSAHLRSAQIFKIIYDFAHFFNRFFAQIFFSLYSKVAFDIHAGESYCYRYVAEGPRREGPVTTSPRSRSEKDVAVAKLVRDLAKRRRLSRGSFCDRTLPPLLDRPVFQYIFLQSLGVRYAPLRTRHTLAGTALHLSGRILASLV